MQLKTGKFDKTVFDEKLLTSVVLEGKRPSRSQIGDVAGQSNQPQQPFHAINNVSRLSGDAPTESATVNVINDTPLLHVRDKLSGTYFLVDLGAEVSIILPDKSNLTRRPSPGLALVTENGLTIKSYGPKTLAIKLKCGKYKWKFQIAKAKPIIGADMLRAFGLIPDLKNRRLICLNSLSITDGIIRRVPINFQGISAISGSGGPDEFTSMLKERPALTTPSLAMGTTKHGVEHHIITKGPPVHSRARRLAPDQEKVAKDQFKMLLDLGIARRSKSP